LSSYGAGEVRITNLLNEEVDAVQKMLLGLHYVTIEDGRLKSQDTRIPLPDPIEDKEMLPFWRKQPWVDGVQQKIMEFEKCSMTHTFPSITIQHLCGYGYSDENYKRQAEKLESYGFEQLRSKRGEDGKYYELWYLGSLILAEGALKDFLESAGKRGQIKKAVDFLCRTVSFGTLDISVQRAAMQVLD